MKGYSWRRSVAMLALTPTWAIVLVFYVGAMLWTVQISLTSSKIVPTTDYVGLLQYRRLFAMARWLTALENFVIFGVLFVALSLVVGFLLAVLIDQRVRFENIFRTVFLYPFSMSFIVSGLIWQWLMNPALGVQKSVRDLGWAGFTFDWAVSSDKAIYALVIAAVWQAAGLVMAILLAALRGVDQEVVSAARIDGAPTWRIYLSIILPSIRPMVMTAVVLLTMAVVKSYDLVVALTNGGPGTASDLPAKFVMDFLFVRQNAGLAMAGATVMLLIAIPILAPWLYVEYFRRARGRSA